MALTHAQMLWLAQVGLKSFIKEGSALGRKYSIVLNGQWSVLNDILESIIAGGGGTTGYPLATLLGGIPGFSSQLTGILSSNGNLAFARTPRLEGRGEGDKADLTLIFEEGLQENSGTLFNPVGPNQSDQEAFTAGSGNTQVPADSSYRLVFEPNDVELGYGLPFRAEYKWDMTIQAPNLSTYTLPNGPIGFETKDGTPDPTGAVKINTLIDGIGYDSTNISLLAVANIWREGSITESQRGAFFNYLNNAATGGGYASVAYVTRILRGETSYRYFVPHVAAIRRYRSPPQVPGFFPLPGAIDAAGTGTAPPDWCNAPKTMYVAGGASNLTYTYWSTGPQVEFTGEFWTAEVQWSGFVDMDTNMYNNPTGAANNTD